MFWSEHDKTGKIERATLAGEERETIVTGAVWIPDMAVDTESKTIYWIDIKRNTVEKCDYDGNNRHVVRRSKFTSITMSGITVYKVVLFFLERFRVLKFWMTDKQITDYERLITVEIIL